MKVLLCRIGYFTEETGAAMGGSCFAGNVLYRDFFITVKIFQLILLVKPLLCPLKAVWHPL